MLHSVNTLRGYKLLTTDGQIGKLDDIYFDDGCWWTRYLVINVGSWLNRQKVLLIPEVVTAIDPDNGTVQVALTTQEVENSPDALEVVPVSREREIALHRHYDWTPYWQVDPVAMSGYGRVPETIVHPQPDVKANVDIANDANAFAAPTVQERASVPDSLGDELDEIDAKMTFHPSGRIQSSQEVIGYHIHAVDGEIGHLEDFLIDKPLKVINYLLVDTQNWLPGKKVVIPVNHVHNIQWDKSIIQLEITREQVKNAPEYDGQSPPIQGA